MRPRIFHRCKLPNFCAPIGRLIVAAVLVCSTLAFTTGQASAADRARLEAFLEVTGFDVALDSIALSASAAPQMLGLEEGAFGADWSRLAEQVFSPLIMRDRALNILEETLEDEFLEHAAAFYSTDLGKRLVQAENLAHFDDNDLIQQAGNRIIDDLVDAGSPRVALFKRMNHAIDPNGIGPQALQEIQIRFLVAAAYSGVVNLRVDEDGLRALMQANEAELRLEIEASSLASAAYTYQVFSNAELVAYAEALEHPDMQVVYELMNAVHFDVMLNRFEVLASRIGDLHPGQEL